jgi:hypothetical protein
MRWTGHVTRMGRGEVLQGFGGESWGKETTWKPRRVWKDNIEMDIREVGWGTWTGSVWFRIGICVGLLWMR